MDQTLAEPFAVPPFLGIRPYPNRSSSGSFLPVGESPRMLLDVLKLAYRAARNSETIAPPEVTCLRRNEGPIEKRGK
jgi:hypothetical protein